MKGRCWGGGSGLGLLRGSEGRLDTVSSHEHYIHHKVVGNGAFEKLAP